jgi:hypothetical protein
MLALSLAVMIVATTCGGVATAVSVVSNTYVLLDNRLTVQWSVSNATTNESNATTIAPNTDDERTQHHDERTQYDDDGIQLRRRTRTHYDDDRTHYDDDRTQYHDDRTHYDDERTQCHDERVHFHDRGVYTPTVRNERMGRRRVRGFRHEWFHRGVPCQWHKQQLRQLQRQRSQPDATEYNGAVIASSINSTTNQFRTTFRMNTSDFNIKNGTQRMIVAFGNWNDTSDFPLKHAPDTRTPLIVDIFAGTMTTTIAPAPTTTRPATFAPNTTLNVTTTVPATSAPTTTAPETNAADDGGDDGFSGTQIAIVIIVILIVVALCICGAVYYFKKKGKASAVAGGAAGHHPRNAGGRAVNYGAEMDEVGAAAH